MEKQLYQLSLHVFLLRGLLHHEAHEVVEARDLVADGRYHARELIARNGLAGSADAQAKTHQEPEAGVGRAPDPSVAGNHSVSLWSSRRSPVKTIRSGAS